MCSLWSIRLVVFINQDLKNMISHLQQSSVKTGIANALGKNVNFDHCHSIAYFHCVAIQSVIFFFMILSVLSYRFLCLHSM